jgi:hypothetical protein
LNPSGPIVFEQKQPQEDFQAQLLRRAREIEAARKQAKTPIQTPVPVSKPAQQPNNPLQGLQQTIQETLLLRRTQLEKEEDDNEWEDSESGGGARSPFYPQALVPMPMPSSAGQAPYPSLSSYPPMPLPQVKPNPFLIWVTPSYGQKPELIDLRNVPQHLRSRVVGPPVYSQFK